MLSAGFSYILYNDKPGFYYLQRRVSFKLSFLPWLVTQRVFGISPSSFNTCGIEAAYNFNIHSASTTAHAWCPTSSQTRSQNCHIARS